MECVIMARFNSLKFESIDLACKRKFIPNKFLCFKCCWNRSFLCYCVWLCLGTSPKNNNNNKKYSHFKSTKAHFYWQLFSMHVLWASILNVSINVDFRILSRGYMLQHTRNQICIINLGSAHSWLHDSQSGWLERHFIYSYERKSRWFRPYTKCSSL